MWSKLKPSNTYIKSRIRDTIDDWYITNLAKNQVSPVFHWRKIIELCMETPCLCSSEQHKHGGRKVKSWPNGVASRRKLKTWIYLRLRLARPCVHLLWLALTCAHFFFFKKQLYWPLYTLHTTRYITEKKWNIYAKWYEVIRSKGQVRTGLEDPCEAPPIKYKKKTKQNKTKQKTKTQIIIKTRFI